MPASPALLDQTLAELADRLPAAARIFHRRRLDYCCGGRRTLRDACASAGLDGTAIATEIAAAGAHACAGSGWHARSCAELIDHIVDRYHGPLRLEMPRLVHLAGKVEAVHAEHPACPHGLAAHLGGMRDAFDEHMRKEEEVLFPLLRDGRGPGCALPVRCITGEHDDHGRRLHRMRALARDLLPPEGACTSWRVLYQGLDLLEQELTAHIHLENNVLFPRALAQDG